MVFFKLGYHPNGIFELILFIKPIFKGCCGKENLGACGCIGSGGDDDGFKLVVTPLFLDKILKTNIPPNIHINITIINLISIQVVFSFS